MQLLLGLLYNRIIANRLILWSKICPEQTAFLLRTIINLAKACNVTLYIGYFDLAKAFDKVSPLLLKSLIRLGVGASIFYTIKATYTVTRCVLKSDQKLSDVFSISWY